MANMQIALAKREKEATAAAAAHEKELAKAVTDVCNSLVSTAEHALCISRHCCPAAHPAGTVVTDLT